MVAARVLSAPGRPIFIPPGQHSRQQPARNVLIARKPGRSSLDSVSDRRNQHRLVGFLDMLAVVVQAVLVVVDFAVGCQSVGVKRYHLYCENFLPLHSPGFLPCLRGHQFPNFRLQQQRGVLDRAGPMGAVGLRPLDAQVGIVKATSCILQPVPLLVLIADVTAGHLRQLPAGATPRDTVTSETCIDANYFTHDIKLQRQTE